MFFKKKVQNITKNMLSANKGRNYTLKLIKKCESKIRIKEHRITYKRSYSNNPIVIIREDIEYKEQIDKYEEDLKVLNKEKLEVFSENINNVNYYLLNNILKEYNLIKR